MTSFPLSIKSVVAAEARIRKSAIGPLVASVAYWIWHKGWDLFFSIRAMRKGNFANVRIGGLDFQYDMRDRAVGRIVYIFREYETREVEVLAQNLIEGMNFIDIGANSGFFTIIASKLVGSSGKVLAFEPSQDNMRILRSNIEANDLQNVEAIESAVCEAERQVTLHLSKINPGDHRTYQSDDARILNAGSPRETIQVAGTSLDEFLSCTRIDADVIKMDIQGAEHHALMGMRDTITNRENILLMTEYWPRGLRAAGSSPSGFLADLHRSGFHFFVAGDYGQLTEVYLDDIESNLTEDEHATIFCSRVIGRFSRSGLE